MKLRLNTLENCRKSFGRVIREYLDGTIDASTARTVGYLLSGMLAYWRLEKDAAIEERLDAIEKIIDGGRL